MIGASATLEKKRCSKEEMESHTGLERHKGE